MNTLYLIPARGGSKGLPGKNIKPFCGTPLILLAIDCARKAGAKEEDICVSTDSDEIADLCRSKGGLHIDFMRPDYLASDTASSYDVIIHALDFYRQRGRNYDRVVLLQPTSPLRKAEDVVGACKLWRDDLDMVVSVCEAKTNPYFNAYESDADGFLHISKGDGKYTLRRQDAPEVMEYNGAVYVINVESLRRSPMNQFRKVIPYRMSAERSVDIDDEFDWQQAERIAEKIGK